ncbi:MAG: hypothetical protein JOZ74_07440 [Bradyrhizobium sp.]|nr:hypothetical protein [Bradyrhizobium sp.]
MDRGDIVVGSKPTGPKQEKLRERVQEKPRAMGVDGAATPVGAAGQREETLQGNKVQRHCGAMSQQRTDSGTTSTPQKFVHLVGCRDPKAGVRKGR